MRHEQVDCETPRCPNSATTATPDGRLCGDCATALYQHMKESGELDGGDE